MSDRLKNRLYAAAIILVGMLVVVLVATAETPDDRVERLGASIRCPVCQGEAIGDSPATMARDMMSLVEERVDQGFTDDAIIDELLRSYSGAVLLDPPASGATLLLWLAPVAALVVGIGIVAWWRRHPGDSTQQPRAEPSTVRRRLIGGLILVGGFAAIVVVAGALLQERSGPVSGAAGVDIENLDEVSNETMEAVIAANLDNPQITGMRLALAERYFAEGDFRSAFPHYLAIAESAEASDAEATTALVRLGWMAYEGNGEVDTATTLFDEALEVSPDSQVALYLKGQVLWCGAGQNEEAADLFRRVLEDQTLAQDTRSQVEADLAAVSSGEACT